LAEGASNIETPARPADRSVRPFGTAGASRHDDSHLRSLARALCFLDLAAGVDPSVGIGSAAAPVQAQLKASVPRQPAASSHRRSG
jgi:hypothetical protein